MTKNPPVVPSNLIDFDELQVHFQPMVDLQTGLIAGLEAHVRCLGQDSPQSAAEIQALAAITGQEDQIDSYMLEMAVRGQALLKSSQASPVPVSVNLTHSAMTAHTPDGLVLPRDRVCIDISERAVLKHAEPVLRQMRAWRQAGYRLAIVQMTSNATLSVAAELDAAVKFSETLLDGVPQDAKCAGRLRDLIRQAAARKLKTAIDGIRRLDQLNFLKETGCDEGQGPLISNPRPMPELVFLVKKGRCW